MTEEMARIWVFEVQKYFVRNFVFDFTKSGQIVSRTGTLSLIHYIQLLHEDITTVTW